MQCNWRQLIQLGLAWLLGLIFIIAASSKILDPAQFATDIKHYKILPLFFVNAVALFLPWWELGAGLVVLIPRLRRPAALILLVFSGVFAVAVISAMVRGLDISCGCFGIGSSKVGIHTLAVDAVTLVAAALLLGWPPRGQVAPPPATTS